MKRDLIVFGEDWGALPSSTQHLIKHLRRDRKVLWINSIGLRKIRMSVVDLKRAFNKCTHSLVGSKKSAPVPLTHSGDDSVVASANQDLKGHTLLTLPAPCTAFTRALSRELMALQLRSLLVREKLHNPIIWTSLPTAGDLRRSFPCFPVIYYCGDDFSALAGVDHSCVARHERELVKHANVIFAASENLLRKFPAHKTHLLSHGVDFDLFSEPCERAADLPDNGRPCAGFYGSLSEWLDIELIYQTAARAPDWNFVFVGKECVDLRVLKSLPNTYFLGPKSHDQLPRYSQHWQASLLPFKNNAQIRACNPLKLKEYLAAGTPIISTDFPALRPYRAAIEVVGGSLQFSKVLGSIKGKYQEADASCSRRQSRALVKSESWCNKARLVDKYLELL